MFIELVFEYAGCMEWGGLLAEAWADPDGFVAGAAESAARPVLGEALAAVSPECLSDAGRVDALVAATRMVAFWQARQMRVLAAMNTARSSELAARDTVTGDTGSSEAALVTDGSLLMASWTGTWTAPTGHTYRPTRPTWPIDSTVAFAGDGSWPPPPRSEPQATDNGDPPY